MCCAACARNSFHDLSCFLNGTFAASPEAGSTIMMSGVASTTRLQRVKKPWVTICMTEAKMRKKDLNQRCQAGEVARHPYTRRQEAFTLFHQEIKESSGRSLEIYIA